MFSIKDFSMVWNWMIHLHDFTSYFFYNFTYEFTYDQIIKSQLVYMISS